MASKVNTILQNAILAAKSDRVEFIDQLSDVIKERVGSSTELAQSFMDQAHQTIETLDRRQLMENLVDMIANKEGDADRITRLEQKIDALTQAVELLNQKIAEK